MSRLLCLVALTAIWPLLALGEIPKPDDAPQPLSPEASAEKFRLPAGFRMELVASEPLIREPSGVCWDARGRLFICELHGYNLEGQFDIEALNATGQLDHEVRRVQADDKAKQKAAAGTYGTVKQLIDSDGDGLMDKANVWADHLPPCHGICAARDGLIVACAPDIVYLADRDDDGVAEVREVLFTGFPTGSLERSINCPIWGPDNWIYVGRGGGGCDVTGPKLPKPVKLPNTDFRIQPDGSAIEPVTGGTDTFGFAFNEAGDRILCSTKHPAIQAAPLPWHYLGRNPDLAVSSVERNVYPEERTYPASKPHPWRTRRAQDPGFAKFYTDRYGTSESAPNGFFTSACSPLVYQDNALPGLQGHYFICEPSQNLVHRGVIEQDDIALKLRRAKGEEASEFLSSSDSWFNPIALAQGPDGAIYVVDFYREIIEDYSAIPRYLQQQYGLINGHQHGRIWKLSHPDMPKPLDANLSILSTSQLVGELQSSYAWRRRTASRLLIDRKAELSADNIAALKRLAEKAGPALEMLYALKGIELLSEDVLHAAMKHPIAAVRVHGLRLADRRFSQSAALLTAAFELAHDADPRVAMQLALSLGESQDPRAVRALLTIAREHSDDPWMLDAILSSLRGREADLLAQLLRSNSDLGNAENILKPLCSILARRSNGDELSVALTAIADSGRPERQVAALAALSGRSKSRAAVELTESGRAALLLLAESKNERAHEQVRKITIVYGLESDEQRRERIERALAKITDLVQPERARIAAAKEVADENGIELAKQLASAYDRATPAIQKTIVDALLSRIAFQPVLLESLEKSEIPKSAITGIQSSTLLKSASEDIRAKAKAIFTSSETTSSESYASYFHALSQPQDLARGEAVFKQHCASCHQAHGIGHSVGPSLTAEQGRAEETFVKDILAPSDSISAGYSTYLLQTVDGRVVSGLFGGETATGITLRQPDGKIEIVQQGDVETLKTSPISTMPDNLAKEMSPADVANVIAWIKSPAAQVILFDEDLGFAGLLKDGDGRAEIATDAFSGHSAISIHPPQRFSARISGWSFRIREKPGPGEYRYLRFAWKSTGAAGVMLEIANQGRWPPANSATFRYVAGNNSTGWSAIQVDEKLPVNWTMVTRDLWKDFGDATVTGLAPTAMGGSALFDRLELSQLPPPESN